MSAKKGRDRRRSTGSADPTPHVRPPISTHSVWRASNCGPGHGRRVGVVGHRQSRPRRLGPSRSSSSAARQTRSRMRATGRNSKRNHRAPGRPDVFARAGQHLQNVGGAVVEVPQGLKRPVVHADPVSVGAESSAASRTGPWRRRPARDGQEDSQPGLDCVARRRHQIRRAALREDLVAMDGRPQELPQQGDVHTPGRVLCAQEIEVGVGSRPVALGDQRLRQHVPRFHVGGRLLDALEPEPRARRPRRRARIISAMVVVMGWAPVTTCARRPAGWSSAGIPRSPGRAEGEASATSCIRRIPASQVSRTR